MLLSILVDGIVVHLLHTDPVDEEDPLIHLEVLHVHRGLKLDQLDSLDDQLIEVVVFNLPLKNADQFTHQVGPQLLVVLGELFNVSIAASFDEENSDQEEHETSQLNVILDCFLILLIFFQSFALQVFDDLVNHAAELV